MNSCLVTGHIRVSGEISTGEAAKDTAKLMKLHVAHNHGP